MADPPCPHPGSHCPACTHLSPWREFRISPGMKRCLKCVGSRSLVCQRRRCLPTVICQAWKAHSSSVSSPPSHHAHHSIWNSSLRCQDSTPKLLLLVARHPFFVVYALKQWYLFMVSVPRWLLVPLLPRIQGRNPVSLDIPAVLGMYKEIAMNPLW